MAAQARIFADREHLHPCEVYVATDSQCLQDLKDDWQRLYQAADQPYLSQSFEWNQCAWETSELPRGSRLHCIVARSSGRVSMIWPLVVARDHLWSIVRPLTGEGGEYTDALGDRTSDSGGIVQNVWRELHKSSHADIIDLPRVRADSLLYSSLDNAPMATDEVRITRAEPAPYVAVAQYDNWDAYYRSLGRDLRNEQKRRVRRLAERGDLRFTMVTGGPEYQAGLEWLVSNKRRWLQANRLYAPHQNSAYYQSFLASVSEFENIKGKLSIATIAVDGKIIAAQLFIIDKFRIEAFVSTYDPEFATYSPGNLLREHCINLAFKLGVDYDFRVGTGEHKETWSGQPFDVFRIEWVLTAWGLAYQHVHKLAKHVLQRKRRMSV